MKLSGKSMQRKLIKNSNQVNSVGDVMRTFNTKKINATFGLILTMVIGFSNVSSFAAQVEDSPVPNAEVVNLQPLSEVGSPRTPLPSEGVVSISAGVEHTCAALDDGTVKCWGANWSGQLGDGTKGDRYIPTEIFGLSNVVSVAAGAGHSCALISDGTVKCWGNNAWMQLGTNQVLEKLRPYKVEGIFSATAITSIGGQTCVLLNDGTVKCWGGYEIGQFSGEGFDEFSGITQVEGIESAILISGRCAVISDGSVSCWQLPSDTDDGTLVSSSVVGVSNVVSLSAEDGHICAVLNDGNIRCWGSNSYGQLGDGTNQYKNSPTEVIGISNAVSVTTGSDHSCAVLANSTVKCWGANYSGQLGDGSEINSLVPVSTSGLSNVSFLTAGDSHTCALLNNGTVKCWGNNTDAGQVGDGTREDRLEAVVVGIDDSVIDISTGDSFTCTLLANGLVECWGLNDSGQLGDGSQRSSLAPVGVAGIDSAISMDSGSTHSCAVLNDGSIECWGGNFDAQLGDGSKTRRLEPVKVDGITSAVSVSTSGSHTCAVLNNGNVKCWGNNTSGQLGNGTRVDSSVPVAVSGVSSAVSVSTGGFHSCAVLSDGSVKCWGLNNYGQLGDGTTSDSSLPIETVGLSPVLSLSAGLFHNCAVHMDSKVSCWGNDSAGQLGGSIIDGSIKVPIAGLGSVVSLKSGFAHTCALLSDGLVKCWGSNSEGLLGDGTKTSRYVPVSVRGISTATSVDLGVSHSCALLLDGSVKCWGRGFWGAIGDGSSSDDYVNPPVESFVGKLSSGVQVSSGFAHTCALLSDGSVKCWGSNLSGQSGNGPIWDTHPGSVLGIDSAKAISSGFAHTCALLSDGSVKCWGSNESGQLGNGTFGEISNPVTVLGVDSATAISSGLAHTCALLSDGSIKCWGSGDYAPLGNGTLYGSPTPVAVVGISSAVALEVGPRHSCALLSDGSIKCWGTNDYGQLGDGSGTMRLEPVFVEDTSIFVDISVGYNHTCAVLEEGSVKCWGGNYFGQLGNGTTANSNLPVQIETLGSITSVSAGGAHTCALRASGEVLCWGNNEQSQVSREDIPYEVSPVNVQGISTGVGISSGYEHTCVISSDLSASCWGSKSGIPSTTLLTLPAVPGQPTINAIHLGQTSLRIDWSLGSIGWTKPLGYRVEIRNSGDSNWEIVHEETLIDQTTFIANLTPGNSIEVRVGLTNAKGTTYSDSSLVRTFLQPMAELESITGTTANLTWDISLAEGDVVSTYYLEFRKLGDDYWSPYTEISSTFSNGTITGLSPNTDYEFQVGAIIPNIPGIHWSNIVTGTTSSFGVNELSTVSTARGAAIDVAGLGFEVVDAVKIGTTTASFVLVSDELIVVKIPTSASSGVLKLYDGSLEIAAGILEISPTAVKATVSRIENVGSAPGEIVTVRGANVGAAISVSVAGLSAHFEVIGADAILVELPANAVNGKITIATAVGSTTSRQSVFVPPRVSSTSMESLRSANLTISGSNFSGVLLVIFDGQSLTPSSVSATSVIFKIPADAETSEGVLVGPGGVSNPFEIEILPPPTLDAFSRTVKVGDSVTLNGSNLQNVTSVKIGSIGATTFSSTRDSVTFVVPARATSGKVTFAGKAGTVVSTSTLTVIPGPEISRVSPTSGSANSNVSISGKNLTGATVYFGGSVATKSTNTATKLTVKVPSGLARGAVTVRVVTANGQVTFTFTVK